jgi:membrane-associated phospholipid phosphatase
MNSKLLLNSAKIISYLFVPPVMNLFIFTIYSLEYESSPISYYGITISFLFGLLIPVLTFLEFRRRGLIVNDDATIKEERTIPYIYAIGFSLTGLILSSLFGLNERIIMMWMVYLVSSILIININKYWKISAHTIGASMPLGALILFPDVEYLLVSTLILSLVIFSRLFLKVHTLLQVLTGSILGFTVAFVLLNYCL